MKKILQNYLKVVLAVLMTASFSSAWSQLSITTADVAVTQNFDGLPSTGTNLGQSGGIFASGWSFLEAGTNATTTYDAGTGSANGGNTYDFGVAGTNAVTERALGMLQSGSLTSILGFKFTNNTTKTITSLVVGYTGEVWRLNTGGDNFAFSYQTGNATTLSSGTWNSVAGLTFTAPVTGAANLVDGNLNANRTVITPVTIAVNMAPGATYTFRWLDGSAGSSAGIAIDDFTITLVSLKPTVTTTAATAITTGGATLNGTVNPNGLTVNTSFDYGLDTSYGSTASSTQNLTGSSAVAISAPVTSLGLNTLYHFRAVASGTPATNGNDLTFYTLAATPGAPVIGNATISSLDVTINGAPQNGNPAATEYAIHETTTNTYVQANGTLGAIAWQTAGTWGTKTVTGLTDNTTYTFEVKARNGSNVETAFGSPASLATLANTTPNFSLNSALGAFGNVCTNATSKKSFSFNGGNLNGSDITISSVVASYKFSLTENGTYVAPLTFSAGSTISGQVVWVEFAPTAVQSYNGNIVVSGGGASSVNVAATGSGINTPATATTGSSSAVTVNSATLAGSLVQGCTSIVYGIEYSTTNNFVTGTQAAGSNLAGGNFSVALSSLSPNTTYYYKAYVTDGLGTHYGLQNSFTTLGLVAPVAATASPILYNGFTAHWSTVTGATSYVIDVYKINPVPVKPWINEFHYDDLGVDANEFVEIVVPNSYAGTGLTLTMYNGSGGASYDTFTLAQLTLGQSTAVYKIYSAPSNLFASGIQNGNPDGFALSDSTGLIQFLSYGGTFAATNGAANGQTSVDMGVAESNSAENSSLGLTNTGSTYANFTWAASSGANTRGNSNVGQTIQSATAIQYVLQNVNAGTGTSYDVTGLVENTQYYYVVRAVSANSTSPNSNEIAVLTAHAPATITSVAQAPGFVCDGAAATFNVTGLLPNITTAITYTIGAQQTTVNVLATGTTGSFTATLALADNGNNLTVNTVERTDFPGNPIAVTGVTAALSVNANVTYYADNDTDGFGNLNQPSVICTGIAPAGYVLNSADCDDTQKLYSDLDGDLFGSDTLVACGGVANTDDCNDSLTLYSDVDGDLFGSDIKVACGGVANTDDCDDNTLLYSDVDGDLFGSDTLVACGGVANSDDCDDNLTLYSDVDGDLFGSDIKVACLGVANSDDCDDNTLLYSDVDGDLFGSDTLVACDGVANSDDCDDTTVRYADVDGDTYGSTVKVACGGSTNNTDCNDNNNAVNPGHDEVGYNLIDDDCDGSVDEGFPPKTTVMQGAQCSTILPSIDTQLMAYLVAGAQGYRWRISTLDNSNNVLEVQELSTQLRVMKLTQLPHYGFNTKYKVEVAVYFAGFLQPFTPSNCTVTTPSPTTSLSVCGQTLTAMNDVIYAGIVPFATGYRFEITEVGNTANTQTIDRSLRDFRMSLVTAFTVRFGKTYQIRVAVKNTDGSYLGFGPVCNVNTPVFPTTFVQDSQCSNYAVPNYTTQIYAYSYPGAISYVFNLSLGAPEAGVEVTKNLRVFTLNDFAGQPLIPGGTYNVRVRMIFNNGDPAGVYGKACTIVIPGSSRQIEGAGIAFNAMAWPNPSADDFNIEITTAGKANVGIKVYDMVGRLLDNRHITVNEIEALKVGSQYPSGVYNIIVSQGEETKTLRVVKR
jgi:hypothetical protein